MVYNWNDFRDNPHIEVEWGDDSHGNRGTRRARTLEPFASKKSRLTIGFLVVAIAALVGSVAFVSTNVLNDPSREQGDGDNAAGTIPLPSYPTLSPTQTALGSPSATTSQEPSEGPSVAVSSTPSTSSSDAPSSSSSPSASQTTAPSAIQKAPPAPIECIDQVGEFYNHAGNNVTCAWFDTVGSYIHKRNCGRTEVGRACLLACSGYNSCTMPEKEPTQSPTNALTLASKSIAIPAAGDTSIKESLPDANLGSASWLKIDADSGLAFHVLLRFDISKHDHSRTVESASLRLKAASDCPSGGYVESTHSIHWDENSVTWATAPDGDGTEIARFDSVKKGYWYSVDVKAAIRPGHTAVSLRLFPVSTDECMYESKEHSSGSAPELRIVYAD